MQHHDKIGRETGNEIYATCWAAYLAIYISLDLLPRGFTSVGMMRIAHPNRPSPQMFSGGQPALLGVQLAQKAVTAQIGGSLTSMKLAAKKLLL